MDVDGRGNEESIESLREELAMKDALIQVLLVKANNRQNSQLTSYTVLEQNSALQDVVQRKTTLLEEQKLEIQLAHDSLKKAQSELFQAQKLESVGRLAAGVAHEINTPIQFVNDSIHFLREAAEDLWPLVHELRKTRDLCTCADTSASKRIEEDIDIEYLQEQIPRALERSIEGLSRVAEIVRSMKEFAHPDSKQWKWADMNRAVTTTLTIARNEFKYVANAEVELAEIPEVLCLPGEINQVLLNLIINAAHAIEDVVKGTGQMGTIRIKTYRKEESVMVEVADTGGGIPEQHRDVVFEPFFTTKEVGKGTGQGLAIAHRVITKLHGGQIWFECEANVGTTFFIQLPIDSTASKAA